MIGSIGWGEAHNKSGVFYRTIYVLVKNDKGQVLVQKRSLTKDLYPDCWDLSVGGHVNFGQSYEETVKRELHEELGVKVNKKDLIPKGEVLVILPKSGEFFSVFEYNLKPNTLLSVSDEEVSKTKWMTMDEIKKSMKNKTLQWYPRPKQTIASLY